MKDWPPIKAWTSIFLIKGSRYFVAINYGGKDCKRWVNLVSVVNGSLCFRLLFEDLNDVRLWLPGWQDIDRENFINENIPSKIKQTYNFEDACLHPSDDSGLIISSDCTEHRPWFLSSETC